MRDLFDRIPPAWQSALQDRHEEIEQIERALAALIERGSTILPGLDHIFAALEIAPEKVRVVIVGQDPYPTPGMAIGRAFAVSENVTRIPGSLRNILKERDSDIGGPGPTFSLREWQEQGVLLLNRILTVSAGESGSHSNLGWKKITDSIVQIAVRHGARGLLWGRHAKELEALFVHGFVSGVHPSPLSASRGFFGSRPFTSVNRLLDQPITW